MSDIQNGKPPAAASEAERAMIAFALKLTRAPAAMGATDVAQLESQGFSQRAVLDIALVASYFNMVNRIADGLGVPLEDGWKSQWEDQADGRT